MQEKRAGGQAHDAEDAVQSLCQHALNFAADKTGSGQVQVGERQHIALNAPLFFFVDRHDQQHADKRQWDCGKRGHGFAHKISRGVQQVENQKNSAPCGKRDAQQAIRERFVMAAFVPEKITDGDVNQRSWNKCGDRKNIRARWPRTTTPKSRPRR